MVEFEINTIQDLYRLMTVAKGGNPEAQQTLNDFLRFDSSIERSNLPNRKMVQLTSYAQYASKHFYQGKPGNPWDVLVVVITETSMGYKSEKSKQFVEMMKKAPDLSALTQEPKKQGLLGRFRDALTRGDET